MSGPVSGVQYSRYQSTEAELEIEMDMSLPEGVTLEELDERASILARALMGSKPETHEMLKERRRDGQAGA